MEEEIRCLTLTQPWATLMALDEKRIETRNWATRYRDLVAIHAAKGLAGMKRLKFDMLCQDEPFRSALANGGYAGGPGLPRGAIVAIGRLVDCVPTHHPGVTNEPGRPWFVGARKGVRQHYYEVPPPLNSNEYAFGNYAPGRFAWLFADMRRFARPIPAKGALGLWRPDAVLAAQIRAAYREAVAT